MLSLNVELVKAQKTVYACLLGGPAVHHLRIAFKENIRGSRNPLSSGLLDWGMNSQKLLYLDKARTAIDEAVEIKRAQYLEKPNSHREDMVDFYFTQATLYLASHNTAAAATTWTACLPLCDHLARRDPDFSALSARAHRQYAISLSALGRFDEGCAEFEKALEIFHPLYHSQPDDTEYRAGLDLTLFNYTDCLAGVGRYDDALVAIDEAIVIRQKRLLEETPPKTKAKLKFHYVVALFRKNSILSSLGRDDEACQLDIQIVSSSREVREDDPENYHSVQIAQSLLHSGDHLWRCGRFDEALDAFQQCVVACDLYVESALARYRRDPSGGPIELVRAHNEANIALVRLDPRLGDIHHIEECVQLLRNAIPRLSSHLTINLAVSLRGYGMALSRIGRFQESCEAYEEAASINRAHYQLNPMENDTSLARALYGYSSALRSLGRYKESCIAGAECVELVRKLPIYHGQPYRDRISLAQALTRHAEYLGYHQQYPDACTVVAEAADLYREQYATYRSATAAERARCLWLAGSLFSSAKRNDEAHEWYQEAITVFEEASVIDRERHIFNCDKERRAVNLAHVLRRYGWCLFQMGRVEEALAALREAVQLFQNLVDAGANDLRQNLAVTHRSMSACLFALELYEESRDSHLVALGLYELLEEQHPGQHGENLSYSMWNLARSYERLDRPQAAWDMLVQEGAVQRPFSTGMYTQLADDISALRARLSAVLVA